jgi:hypothetical protein
LVKPLELEVTGGYKFLLKLLKALLSTTCFTILYCS